METQVAEAKPPIQRINAYDRFQAGEGIPVVRGLGVEDLRTLELAPWARTGGRGAFLNLAGDGTGGRIAAYVGEIPPGASLNPQRHLFEEMIYIVEGNGSTVVWFDEGQKVSFEWKAGSLFAIPLNAWYRLFNGQGSRPARYIAVNNAPMMMNWFHNERFIFDNPFVFDDRFAGDGGYFDGEGTLYRGSSGRNFVLETNFVPDTHNIRLYDWNTRGAGGSHIGFELADNTMSAHISEFPVGTYKKAHRHGPVKGQPGAHIVLLSGQGFSLLWVDDEPVQRFDWHPGSLFVAPNQWFHQHFNTGAEPARYLALRTGSYRYVTADAVDGADVDIKEGGWQIEYRDEDRQIHATFEAELAKSGATCRMRPMVPWCTGPE
jgi:mannose-6-phosphate isomerase-like protein (cupin superfamily)